jgi:hypothetical protein
MGKVLITIILINIEIMIIHMIVFELEDIYSACLSQNKRWNWELWSFALKKIHKMVKNNIFQSNII